VKLAYLRDKFKKAPKSVCTSTVVVSPDPMSPTPSTFLAMKIPENIEKEPDKPEAADADIQMEYSD